MQFILAIVLFSSIIGNLKGTPTALKEILTDATLFSTDLNPLYDIEDANLTVPTLIEKYGYPVEIYDVTTKDGYILEVHRIPHSKSCGPVAEGDKPKEVAFLQHGLLGDSSHWVLSGVNKGLAYLLADACYDVWLGNARGNTYSRRHETLDPIKDKSEFWSFSWHEMGIYDLPAVIDYALNVTEAQELYYVGHSMGTTMFWVCMSERPEYNSKIKLMNSLAPIAYMTNMKSPIRALAPIANDIEALLLYFGIYEFLPTNAGYAALGAKLCDPENPYHPICSNLIFILCGFNPDQMELDFMPLLVGHGPGGTSTKTVIHYAQGVNQSYFRQYDYGLEENLLKYGQDTPPDYNIKNIIAPVALYWGNNDYLANITDVDRLSNELPNVKLDYRMRHDKFNHLDFVYAKDVKTLVNEPLMHFMATGEELTTTTTTTLKPPGGDRNGASLMISGYSLIFATLILVVI